MQEKGSKKVTQSCVITVPLFMFSFFTVFSIACLSSRTETLQIEIACEEQLLDLRGRNVFRIRIEG